ncbi:putative enzymatic polyprotein, partial [Gregarina niphandrodes]
MEWLGVPFGLLNGTSALARWLYLNVIDLEGVAVYVDDIVIHADDETTLLKYFEAMMKRLHEIGAYINVTKCKFGVDEIEFLGFNIKGGRLTPPRESIKAINAIKLPHDTTTIRRFLGMVGYFRNFIKDFANIAGPLYELLQKEVTFKMTDERISAFHLLQKALSECPGLANPHPSWPYVLDTDASTTAIGACLMQLDENNCLHPVRFGSRRLTPAERNWPIYELEGFAVVHFILAFRPYLIGRTFTVRSDHKPLQWLWKIDKPRLARWSMALQQFDFKIVYNPGTAQEQVDIFTRDVDFTTADEYVDRHLGMVNVEKPVEDRAARQLERL